MARKEITKEYKVQRSSGYRPFQMCNSSGHIDFTLCSSSVETYFSVDGRTRRLTFVVTNKRPKKDSNYHTIGLRKSWSGLGNNRYRLIGLQRDCFGPFLPASAATRLKNDFDNAKILYVSAY